jgi:hypothetical protein
MNGLSFTVVCLGSMVPTATDGATVGTEQAVDGDTPATVPAETDAVTRLSRGKPLTAVAIGEKDVPGRTGIGVQTPATNTLVLG